MSKEEQKDSFADLPPRSYKDQIRLEKDISDFWKNPVAPVLKRIALVALASSLVLTPTRKVITYIQTGGSTETKRHLIEDELGRLSGTLDERIKIINEKYDIPGKGGYFLTQNNAGEIEFRFRPSASTYYLMSIYGWCDPISVRDGVMVGKVEL